MSMFKKAATVSAAVAFLRSPAGKQMIEKAKVFAADPRTKAKAAEIAEKLRRSTPRQP